MRKQVVERELGNVVALLQLIRAHLSQRREPFGRPHALRAGLLPRRRQQIRRFQTNVVLATRSCLKRRRRRHPSHTEKRLDARRTSSRLDYGALAELPPRTSMFALYNGCMSPPLRQDFQ